MNPADVSLTWGEVFSAIGVTLTLISLFGGLVFTLYRRISSVKAELDQFKLEVAKEYVGSDHLTEMKADLIRTEERTLAAIQGLAERFDRFLTKQDN